MGQHRRFGGIVAILGLIAAVLTAIAMASPAAAVDGDPFAPSVRLQPAPTQLDPTGAAPVRFDLVTQDVDLDADDVLAFEPGDVVVSGTAGGTPTVELTHDPADRPTGFLVRIEVSGFTTAGTVRVTVPAGTFHDQAGNPAPATDATVRWATVPEVRVEQFDPGYIEGRQLDPTNADVIRFLLTFSEPVEDVSRFDVVLGGTAGGPLLPTLHLPVGGDGTIWAIEVRGMSTPGTVTAAFRAGGAFDADGNPNLPSKSVDNEVTWTDRPTVVISRADHQQEITTASPTFWVDVNGPNDFFTSGDPAAAIAAGGTAGGDLQPVLGALLPFPDGAMRLEVTVVGMTSPGTVHLTMAGDSVHDAEGDGNLPVTGPSVTWIGDEPRVTVEQSARQPDPTDDRILFFTAHFSERVRVFDESKIVVSGTAGGPLEHGVLPVGEDPFSSDTWEIAVVGMTSPGNVAVSLLAGAASDVICCLSLASTSVDNVVAWGPADTTAPSVAVGPADGQPDPTGTPPIRFTATFDEPVIGFTAGDVDITGTAGGGKQVTVEPAGGNDYTITVTGMTTAGTVVASIPAGAAEDPSGNRSAPSPSSASVSWTLDTTRPTVVVDRAAGQADPTNAGPLRFTAAFSEPVIGLTGTDVVVTGSAGGTKTATVTPTSGSDYLIEVGGMTTRGTVTVSIPAGVASDGAGNLNEASTAVDAAVLWDATRPTVTVEQTVGQPDPTGAPTIRFTATFDEPVADFTADDVVIEGTAGGSMSAEVTPTGGNQFGIEVSGMAAPTGTVVVSVPAGAATDGIGNPNVASTSVDGTVTWTAPDAVAPTVAVAQAAGQADPAGTAPIRFTATFSEPVTGFTAADVAISGTAGGTRTATVAPAGANAFTIEVSGMTTGGTVVVSIPAGAATDAAGNPSAASTATDATVTWAPTGPPPVTRTIVGKLQGSVTVAAGEHVLIERALVTGSVTVLPGGALTVSGGGVNGRVTADRPASLSICGANLGGATVTNAPVAVRVGDPANGCAGNRPSGTVVLRANRGVTFSGNVSTSDVTVEGNGPDATVLAGNTVRTLSCTGNAPAPTNGGQPNRGARSGQCASL